MQWTTELDEKCQTLWQQGYSALRIGQELGGISRNAVLGRLHRTGQSKRPTKLPSVRLRRYSNTPYLRRHNLTRMIFADVPQPNAETNVGLLAVKKNQCREIVGHDGLAVFCGAHATGSFCAYHHNINYRPRSELCESKYIQPNGSGANVEAAPGQTATLKPPYSSDIAA
jgi:hypothetical protein